MSVARVNLPLLLCRMWENEAVGKTVEHALHTVQPAAAHRNPFAPSLNAVLAQTCEVPLHPLDLDVLAHLLEWSLVLVVRPGHEKQKAVPVREGRGVAELGRPEAAVFGVLRSCEVPGLLLLQLLGIAPVWVLGATPTPPPPQRFTEAQANQFLASFELTSAFKPFNYAPAGSAA